MLPMALRLPRFVGRSLGLLVLIVVGLLLVVLGFGRLPERARNAIGVTWSRILMRLCGIRVNVRGAAPATGAVLWVSNHVSWLDIYVLNSVRYTSFVAKGEIQRWPLLGRLISGAGTIYINRSQRHAVRAVAEAMHERFRAGSPVGLFPEGTTSPGYGVLPLYASLLEPALVAQVCVQPVALLFKHNGVRSHVAAYTGEQTLLANLWIILGTRQIEIDAVFLEPLATQGKTITRHELGQQIHSRLAKIVNTEPNEM